MEFDPDVLKSVMLEIYHGRFFHGAYSGDSEDKHRGLVERLRLLDYLEITSLKAKAIKGIIRCVRNCTEKSLWGVDEFFTKHYDPLTGSLGGNYPKELYKAFALAWRAFRRGTYDDPDERLVAVVEANSALAVFLVSFYSDKLVHAEEDTTHWLEIRENDDQEIFVMVQESIWEVEKSVKAMQKAVDEGKDQIKMSFFSVQDIAVDMDA